ncbi:MAG: hypothetical protein WC415_02990 [Patescibacteria group bacterium]|jgi:hypothetical protein
MFNKVIRFFCLFFLSIITVTVINASASVYIWAMKKPVAFAPFSWLDHTYVCVGNSNNCYTCPPTYTKTGGNPAVGGYGDGDDAVCYAYCTLSYGVNGVCHQHSNRVLYPAGQTLAYCGVTGYTFSVGMWGTYGTNFNSCDCD